MANLLTFLLVIFLGFGLVFQSVRSEYGDLAGNWLIDYGQAELRLLSNEALEPILRIDGVQPRNGDGSDLYFVIRTIDTVRAEANHIIQFEQFAANGSWQGAVTVQGKRFGYSQLIVELHSQLAPTNIETSSQELPIAVLRDRVVDERITTYVSAALALLMFLNLGTVLDLQRLQGIICRPIGPMVGIASRFVMMPGLAFGLGRALWSTSSANQQALQLALFYTALAPSGGLANVCAVFLKGNVNLSVATTTINSLLALAFLPLWIMVMARYVYDDDQLMVPFGQLSGGTVALVVCLALGMILRLCVPKTTRFIFRFLKPLSVVLSLCLVGLTVGLNWFVFAEFSWQVLVAALCLPIAGYMATYLLSKLLCRSPTDALTLAIETSVLNMTMPIVLLQSSRLEQPQMDLVLVVPIASSLISLLLVVVLYVVRRCFGWNVRQDDDGFDHKRLLAEHDETVYQRP
ncbi:ileal sodium/bile acid cotransporter [Drosophila tropicalis]|uniref:ileal sodium/bile acid cotransporter n=1 Tax=Drosophila tropicalis TaxID=46794 RepID=UPI0035ABAD3C